MSNPMQHLQDGNPAPMLRSLGHQVPDDITVEEANQQMVALLARTFLQHFAVVLLVSWFIGRIAKGRKAIQG